MVQKIYLDFETRSAADLKTVGAALYAEHPTTDVLCVGFSNNTSIFMFSTDMLSPLNNINSILHHYASNPEIIFVSHNAMFEELIWEHVMVKKYNYPPIPEERWQCTMAKAYAHGLPGSLKDIANTLDLPIKKDLEGRKMMLNLSKPRKNGNFWSYDERPDMFNLLYEYCKKDVEVCKLIDETLPDLLPSEQKLWVFDQKMNKRGVHVDVHTVNKAVTLIETHKDRLHQRLGQLTNGEVTSVFQRARLLEFFNRSGLKLKDTQKSTLIKINGDGLPDNVNQVLEIVKEIAKSSVSKYSRMIDRSNSDGLVREIDQYHAAHTGRFGGKGIQLQNLPRPLGKEYVCIEDIRDLKYDEFLSKHGHKFTNVLSSSLRGMVVPPSENMFLIGDFAQMEARVLAWLAGQHDVLNIFRSGQDLYCIEASNIFGKQVTKENKNERQIGKVAVLALGYGGGIGAFAKMAKGYDVDLKAVYDHLWPTVTTDEESKALNAYDLYTDRVQEDERVSEEEALVTDVIKQRWRAKNQNIVAFWKQLEQSTRKAMKSPEQVIAGLLRWHKAGPFLFCQLPSGRSMAYPFPSIVDNKLSFWSAEGREYTYGGKLSENITQAVQRDLLTDAILRLDEAGMDVVFHVHDEIVCKSNDKSDLQKFTDIMKQNPDWSTGLPIDVDAKTAERYEK